MHHIVLTVAALGLTGCAAASSPYGGMSAQNVNCGAGVLGAAVLGGLAGNQIGKGRARTSPPPRERPSAACSAPHVPNASRRPTASRRHTVSPSPTASR